MQLRAAPTQAGILNSWSSLANPCKPKRASYLSDRLSVDMHGGGLGHWCLTVSRHAGLFGSWAEVEPLVRGFKGALHKSFRSQKEAEAFLATHGINVAAATAAGGKAAITPAVVDRAAAAGLSGEERAQAEATTAPEDGPSAAGRDGNAAELDPLPHIDATKLYRLVGSTQLVVTAVASFFGHSPLHAVSLDMITRACAQMRRNLTVRRAAIPDWPASAPCCLRMTP